MGISYQIYMKILVRRNSVHLIPSHPRDFSSIDLIHAFHHEMTVYYISHCYWITNIIRTKSSSAVPRNPSFFISYYYPCRFLTCFQIVDFWRFLALIFFSYSCNQPKFVCMYCFTNPVKVTNISHHFKHGFGSTNIGSIHTICNYCQIFLNARFKCIKAIILRIYVHSRKSIVPWHA